MKSFDVTKESVGRSESTRPTCPSAGRLAGGLLLVFLLGFHLRMLHVHTVGERLLSRKQSWFWIERSGTCQSGPECWPVCTDNRGKAQRENDSAYVIAVRSVRYFNGGTNVWSGEPLSVGTSMVQEARERRFSPSKTGVSCRGRRGWRARIHS